MRTGELDERVTIQHRVGAQDPVFKSFGYSWEDLATVWADVRDLLPSRAESVEDGVALRRAPCKVVIRYRTDITSDMRLVIRGRSYRIVSGPAEFGRRDGLAMVCEELSTEGQEP